MSEDGKTLTCVYCGMAYPGGTPPHGAKILTDHIKICPSHPMREAEEKIRILRKALSNMFGSDDVEELEKLKIILSNLSGDDESRALSIQAIEALLKVGQP